MALNLQKLNTLQPLQVVRDEQVRDKFINLYDTLWGEGEGLPAYERESIYFNQILSANESLKKATPFSIFSAFIELAVNGLSLRPGTQAQAYLTPSNTRVGRDSTGRDIYESRCTFTVSGYGEIALRIRAGQILHADNPVIVYEEDAFTFSEIDGRKSISYTCRLPHTSGRITAVYMGITRTDRSRDYAVMLPEEWERLAQFSAKKNKRWDAEAHKYVESPNALYTSGTNGQIDTGFLMAKCIKHAFRTYPKVRIGRDTALETNQVDDIATDDLYGFDQQPAADVPQAAAPQQVAPAEDFHAAAPVQGVIQNPAATPAEDDGAF